MFGLFGWRYRQQEWLDWREWGTVPFASIAGVTGRNNIAYCMRSAFREWCQMILSQKTAHSFATKSTAMIIRGLDFLPLLRRKIIDWRSLFQGAVAAQRRFKLLRMLPPPRQRHGFHSLRIAHPPLPDCCKSSLWIFLTIEATKYLCLFTMILSIERLCHRNMDSPFYSRSFQACTVFLRVLSAIGINFSASRRGIDRIFGTSMLVAAGRAWTRKNTLFTTPAKMFFNRRFYASALLALFLGNRRQERQNKGRICSSHAAFLLQAAWLARTALRQTGPPCDMLKYTIFPLVLRPFFLTTGVA